MESLPLDLAAITAGKWRVHSKIRAPIKPTVKGKSPKVTRNLAGERLKVFAVCKKCNMVRCSDVEQMQAEEGEGAGDAQVAGSIGAQRQLSGQGLCPGAGCVRARVGRAGQAGPLERSRMAPSLSSAPGRHRRRQRPRLAGDLLREAAIPRSPQGLPASCLPASPGGIHLN